MADKIDADTIEEQKEERIRQKLKDEQDSPFGRSVSLSNSLVFRLYPEETIIENLRKKGWKITKP